MSTSSHPRRLPNQFRPRIAARLNPDLAINPDVTTFGLKNAILTGNSHRYYVPDFAGPLSLKATLQGSATWRVEGRQFRVCESTYLVINDGQPYTIAYDEPTDVTTFVLLFKRGYLEQIAAGMVATGASLLDDPFLALPLDVPLHLHAGQSKVLRQLRMFAHELGRTAIGAETWDARFHNLAIALIRETRLSSPNPFTISATKLSTRVELLRRATIGRDFLISTSENQKTVEDAARAACLSTFHFHRVFAQAFGVSPHVFLRDARLERAANLLRDTDLPIFQIVGRIGLRSVTSFTNAFRQKYGSTPDRFRSVYR